MTYRMFIDDERFPPQDGNEWVICRCMAEVIATVKLTGFPSFISFDHDLGADTPDGCHIAHWLVEYDMDMATMPKDFDYYVHSQNPVGAANIKGLLDNYLRTKA